MTLVSGTICRATHTRKTTSSHTSELGLDETNEWCASLVYHFLLVLRNNARSVQEHLSDCHASRVAPQISIEHSLSELKSGSATDVQVAKVALTLLRETNHLP